ncbi:MAG: hypothetical protein K940chlam8_00058 [Chlamydiae bacterium]|nr:hypothetical protein [Chlamydiota bacterium]
MSQEIQSSSLSPLTYYDLQTDENVAKNTDNTIQEICQACFLKNERTNSSYYKPSKSLSRLLNRYEQNPFEVREKCSYWTCKDGMEMIHKGLMELSSFISQRDFLEDFLESIPGLRDDLWDVISGGDEDEIDETWTVDCGDYRFEIPEKAADTYFNMKKQMKYSVYHALICLLHDSIKHRMLYEKSLLENDQCKNVEWSKNFIFEKGPQTLQFLEAFDEQLGSIFIKAYDSFFENFLYWEIVDDAKVKYEKAIERYNYCYKPDEEDEEAVDIARNEYLEAKERAKNGVVKSVTNSDDLSLLWERSLLLFQKGDFSNAIKGIDLIMTYGKEHLDKLFLCSQCGSISQPSAFQNTINTLSKSIEQNPEDKEAILQKVLADLEANPPEISFVDSPIILEATGVGRVSGSINGALLGVVVGIKEESIELILSVKDIVYAVGSLIFQPIDTLQSGWRMGKDIREYWNTHSWQEIAQDYSPEYRKLSTEWEMLSSKEVAQTIGFMTTKEITRLAINILTFKFITKVSAALRTVKAANSIGKKLHNIKRLKRAIEASMKLDGVTLKSIPIFKLKPDQTHHFATNKHMTRFTEKMNKVVKPFGLNLEDSWNKEMMEHVGRHPHAYHEFVLEEMEEAAIRAEGDVNKFLELFEENVKKPIRENPKLLTKEGWPDG